MMRPQPSTRIKSRILKGSEIITGGSIIMPIDISAAATTRSITRNGIKMTNPMMKAARSSEIINAGMRVTRSTSAGLTGLAAPAARVIRARSSWRVKAIIQVRSGSLPAANASSKLSEPSR